MDGSGGRDSCALQRQQCVIISHECLFGATKTTRQTIFQEIFRCYRGRILSIRCVEPRYTFSKKTKKKHRRVRNRTRRGCTADSGKRRGTIWSRLISRGIICTTRSRADCTEDNEIMVEIFVQQCTNNRERARGGSVKVSFAKSYLCSGVKYCRVITIVILLFIIWTFSCTFPES